MGIRNRLSLQGFRQLARRLRLLSGLRVQYRRVDGRELDDAWADVDKLGDGEDARFVVRIASTVDQPGVTYLLIHETAHAITWDIEEKHGEQHSPEFWITYGRLYDALIERSGLPKTRFSRSELPPVTGE